MKSFTNLFKVSFWISIFCAVLFLFPSYTYALKVRDVPNPRQEYGGWVTDMANLLSKETEAKLDGMISELESKNGSEIAVVTVPETAPYSSPKEFATELFNTWGIGKKGIDNGVLFLVSKGDKRVEIETGYGVESILPDAKVGNIIQKQIIPEFKQGKFETGIVAGTKSLIIELGGTSPVSPNRDIFSIIWDFIKGIWPIVIIILIWILGSVYSKLKPFIKRLAKQNNKVFVHPDGSSYGYKNENITICCTRCELPMNEIEDRELVNYLNQPQKIAQKLAGVKFKGWQCSKCSKNLEQQPIHIRRYREYYNRYSECPTCCELTVKTISKTIAEPTTSSEGKKLITEKCQCCEYTKQFEQSIPRLPKRDSSSSRSSSKRSSSKRSSNSSSSSYYSDSSSSSSSGSGSSFGGGESGGGGAGGDW